MMFCCQSSIEFFIFGYFWQTDDFKSPIKNLI
jgi:hypothetical protein